MYSNKSTTSAYDHFKASGRASLQGSSALPSHATLGSSSLQLSTLSFTPNNAWLGSAPPNISSMHLLTPNLVSVPPRLNIDLPIIGVNSMLRANQKEQLAIENNAASTSFCPAIATAADLLTAGAGAAGSVVLGGLALSVKLPATFTGALVSAGMAGSDLLASKVGDVTQAACEKLCSSYSSASKGYKKPFEQTLTSEATEKPFLTMQQLHTRDEALERLGEIKYSIKHSAPHPLESYMLNSANALETAITTFDIQKASKLFPDASVLDTIELSITQTLLDMGAKCDKADQQALINMGRPDTAQACASPLRKW